VAFSSNNLDMIKHHDFRRLLSSTIISISVFTDNTIIFICLSLEIIESK
jgi:hypothetical protein